MKLYLAWWYSGEVFPYERENIPGDPDLVELEDHVVGAFTTVELAQNAALEYLKLDQGWFGRAWIAVEPITVDQKFSNEKHNEWWNYDKKNNRWWHMRDGEEVD